jgi:hypothetical protein
MNLVQRYIEAAEESSKSVLEFLRLAGSEEAIEKGLRPLRFDAEEFESLVTELSDAYAEYVQQLGISKSLSSPNVPMTPKAIGGFYYK